MRILVAEDDPRLGDQLKGWLEEAGFVVDLARDGREAEYLGSTETYDAVVLDLGLPGLDGLGVLEQWRSAGQGTPVLVLSARRRWHEKLAGFNAGADDYLTKPFEPEELVVRLHALIRRSSGHATPVLECGGLRLDVHGARFQLDGEPLSLTAQEFRILSYLMHHQGRVVSRAELRDHVYGLDADPDSNVMDVLVSRIRRKLDGAYIETVRGQGFRLSGEAGLAR
jgi:two-component system OmpR family response regulator